MAKIKVSKGKGHHKHDRPTYCPIQFGIELARANLIREDIAISKAMPRTPVEHPPISVALLLSHKAP